MSFERDHGDFLRYHLTGRECHYAGAKCQYRDADGNRPCWQPATHRVQNGPWAWWFVCARHVPAVATSEGWALRQCATTPGQVAAARLIVELGRFARRWTKRERQLSAIRNVQCAKQRTTLHIELHGFSEDHERDGPPSNPWWARCRVPLKGGGECTIDSGRRATAWEAIDTVTDHAVALAERLAK